VPGTSTLGRMSKRTVAVAVGIIAVTVGFVIPPAHANDGIGKGKTIRGSAYYQFTSQVPGFFQFGVNLPARARNPLSRENVNFAPDSYAVTTDDDPSCTGNYVLPTAPPGKLCLYLWPAAPFSDNVTSITAGGDAADSPEFSRNAFWISWQTTQSSSAAVYVYARWAYTAP
jgi:hypothetical protein